jgi:hypothetical protein
LIVLVDRRLKIDFVTKIRKVGSEKSVFFVEWLIFTGKGKNICNEQKTGNNPCSKGNGEASNEE